MKTRIKNLREDNDLTQKQLSSFLNISQVAYSYYEINKRNIPLELLSQLADYSIISNLANFAINLLCPTLSN